ncbi:MAG: SAM-dependent methyltransferase [Burkholderiales bacterium]
MAFVHRIARYCASGFLFLSLGAPASEVERTGGPYVPTPQAVVDAMLDLAKVSADDFVVDLGSGDGRIVLTAALRYSASGLGIDIDPELVESSNGEAQKRGIGERIRFIQQDVLKANVAEATVLTLYLLPGMMQSLQSKLSNELRPGTRIVSHDFTFGDWKADREVSIDIPEKYGSPGQWKSTIYYWLVPARVQGQWELTAPELVSAPAPLVLTQRYQAIEGVVNARGRRVPISAGRMEADRVEFKLRFPGGVYAFRGSVHGDRMHGEASSGERVVRWSAVRAPDTGAH